MSGNELFNAAQSKWPGRYAVSDLMNAIDELASAADIAFLDRANSEEAIRINGSSVSAAFKISRNQDRSQSAYRYANFGEQWLRREWDKVSSIEVASDDPPFSAGEDSVYDAPAAGRLVRLSHNQSGFGEAREALADVSRLLESGNDVGDLSIDEVESARLEIWHLQQAFNAESVRVDWIVPLANTSLRWIADKAAGAAVGQAAAKALKLIIHLLAGQ